MLTGKMAESTPRKCAAPPHIDTVCRCCNNSLIPPNHPEDLFGQKAMKIDTLKLIGIHVAHDDGLPQDLQAIFQEDHQSAAVHRLVLAFAEAAGIGAEV